MRKYIAGLALIGVMLCGALAQAGELSVPGQRIRERISIGQLTPRAAPNCTDYWVPGVVSQTYVAGHTYCPNAPGTYTFGAAQAVSASNVTIYCPNKAMILQRTGATDGFDLSGTNDRIEGCTIDGNSQTASGTGPLINISGTDDTATNLYFQNMGTSNPTLATINIQQGSTRPTVTYNVISGTEHDQAIAVNYANTGSSPVVDGLIGFNRIPDYRDDAGSIGGGVTQLNAIVAIDNSGSAAIQGLQVIHNYIGMQGSNGSGINLTGGNISPTTATHRNLVLGNQIYLTGNGDFLMKVFAMGEGTVVANNLFDQNGHVAVHGWLGGDLYSIIFAGNTDVDGGLGNSIECDDCGQDIFSSNSVTGTGSTNFGIYLESVGGTSTHSTSNNIVRDNFVSLGAAAACYVVDVSGSGNGDSNQISGNECLGTGAINELGVEALQTSGTESNALIIGNQFVSIATGVTIGSGVTGANVQSNTFSSVTTNVTNNSTVASVKIGDTNAETAYLNTLSTAAGTNFGSTSGVSTVGATEANFAQSQSRGGQIRNLFCLFTAAQGSAKSDAMTVRVTHAGTPSSTTVTCTATNATSCNDTTHVGTYVQGDLLAIQDVTTGTSITARNGTCSIELDQGQIP